MGSGAGGHGSQLKLHHDVRGVDISDGMMNEARKMNPEVIYHKGDMRTVQLDEIFDVVLIPESITYMTTIADVRIVIENAMAHLKLEGILMVLVQDKEGFEEHNFSYRGKGDGVQVDLFENNTVVSDTTYEAAMVYLIRQDGELSIYSDVHTLGLFPKGDWDAILTDNGTIVSAFSLDDAYDQWLLTEGKYRQLVYVVQKNRS
ncbi:methyltransferase domain-containing protein [Salisediminibacterium selenitireducens]|uniref:methyltransferase domain-containing protein n=1 Tax=Salisediminibacterium selenitireducens TaxID=85683 RepID=UPI000304BCC7|nr:class I SAM-dependent methyltransferase [Salisediminibacterium selenitireducens]